MASVSSREIEDDLNRSLQRQLLKLANDERREHGLRELQLDDFASSVAVDHARDMAQGEFLSHWGRDGRKPYHRYSFAGGTEATEENEGAADHSMPFVTFDDAAQDVMDSHLSMYRESPPNDGHRRTILTPHHTHVGFGVALKYGHVRLTELYVARYIAVDSFPMIKPPRSTFILSGRVLSSHCALQSADIFYEQLPSPPDLQWLRVVRPYGLPADRTTLMPKLPATMIYENGSRGDIEMLEHGQFRMPIALGKLRGIYTVVIWLKRSRVDKAFPATEICIRVE